MIESYLIFKCLVPEKVVTCLFFCFFQLQLRVRHRVQTDVIVQINREMSPFQRQKLETIPFKWLLCLEEPLQISNVVVKELVSRWSSIDLCFRIREYLDLY